MYFHLALMWVSHCPHCKMETVRHRGFLEVSESAADHGLEKRDSCFPLQAWSTRAPPILPLCHSHSLAKISGLFVFVFQSLSFGPLKILGSCSNPEPWHFACAGIGRTEILNSIFLFRLWLQWKLLLNVCRQAIPPNTFTQFCPTLQTAYLGFQK